MALFSFPAQVNERAARLVAAVVAVTAVASLVGQWRWPIALLAAGFWLRVGWGPRFSPLARAAVAAALRLWPALPVAGPPKRFAQGIGAVVTTVAAASLASGGALGWGLVGVLAVFATLEAGFGICFGCWAYGQLQRLGVVPADACVECAELRTRA